MGRKRGREEVGRNRRGGEEERGGREEVGRKREGEERRWGGRGGEEQMRNRGDEDEEKEEVRNMRGSWGRKRGSKGGERGGETPRSLPHNPPGSPDVPGRSCGGTRAGTWR